MEDWLYPSTNRFAFLLLVAAGVGFFVASRAAADALRRNASGRAIQSAALGHWLVIACVCVFAVIAGAPGISLSVIFATSVACLSLLLGIVSLVAPMTAPPSAQGRTTWPFVLPAAMLALIAGLSGKITVTHASALIILGIVLAPVVWRRMRGAEEPEAGTPGSPGAPALVASDRLHRVVAAIQLAVALVLAGQAAWAAVHGAAQLHERSRLLRAPLVTSALIAPSLVLPILSSSSSLVHRGQSAHAITLYSLVVLLNLCVLLPVTALLWYAQPQLTHGIGQISELWTGGLNPPMVFPMLTWRLDAFVLVVLGVMLLPVSAGRWMLGRYEGIGLLIGYGMYLMLTVAMSLR